MVVTSAFIVGLNFKSFRAVIALDGAYEMSGLMQYFGRSSRDGQHSHRVVIACHSELKDSHLRQYCTQQNRCLRVTLHLAFGEQVASSKNTQHEYLCNVCLSSDTYV